MPSTNLRERLDGMIWEAADITTYFRFDGASFLAPVSVMGCTPSNCCSEGSKKGSKGVSALRFSAVTNSFNINANVKAKTVEMTEATEISRKKKSTIVTLKVPSYRESLRSLEKTQHRPPPIPITPLKTSAFVQGNGGTHGYGTVHMSKERYIAWFMEDPDPDPPTYQENLPPEVTKFEYTSLYNTGACMWGCSGPPPGTGCPICNPVDLKIPLRSPRPQWDGTG